MVAGAAERREAPRRRCRGAAQATDEDGSLLRPWTDAAAAKASSRRKGVFAKRRTRIAAARPELTAVELDCMATVKELKAALKAQLGGMPENKQQLKHAR